MVDANFYLKTKTLVIHIYRYETLEIMFYISYKKVLLVINNILPTLDISQVLIKSRNVMTMPFAIIWNLSSITKQVYNEGNINSYGSHCLSIISEAPCIYINVCTDVHI